MRYTPKEELKVRRDRLQIYLQESGIDGALLCENMDLFYFSGSMQRGFLYIPAEGEPVYMVQRSFPRGREESALQNVILIKSSRDMPSVLKKYGYNPTRLGLELDVLPVTWFKRLQKIFPETEMSDVSFQVRKVRMIKTLYEINLFRETAVITDKMYSKIPSFLVKGMTEIELASRLEAFLRNHGHQGLGRMRGFNQEMFFGHLFSGVNAARLTFLESPTGGAGLSPSNPQSAGWKAIQAGEPIMVDYGGAKEGYVIDMARCFAIGTLSAKLQEAHQVALKIQAIVMQKASPGAKCSELYNLALAEVEKSGLDRNFMGHSDEQVKFIGHGLGLEYDEFPYIAKGSDFILEDGMVIALEPKFLFPGEGAVGIENSWLITSQGAEKLTLTPDALVII